MFICLDTKAFDCSNKRMLNQAKMPRRSKDDEPSSTLLERRGRAVRRMTVYLPEELRTKLFHYCVDNDLEISGVIEEAVTKLLAKKN